MSHTRRLMNLGKFPDIHSNGGTHGRRQSATVDKGAFDAIRPRFRHGLDDREQPLQRGER